MKASGKNLVFKRPVKGRGFFAPRYSPGIHRLIRLVGRGYLPLVEKIGSIEIRNAEKLIESFHEFYRDESRLIILFRHPSRKDPTALGYALNVILPRLAKKAGRPFSCVPHARFLYGKDVLNWAGPAAVWAFPRLGHIPIQNLRANKEGMNLLRKELKEGQFPIILAPEGQVTYHEHRCSPIASGFSSLAQWGLESGKKVILFPVSIGYKYGQNHSELTKQVLGLWQKETGEILSSLTAGADVPALLYEATEKTLTILEDFYGIPHEEPCVFEPGGTVVNRKTAVRIERICLTQSATGRDCNCRYRVADEHRHCVLSSEPQIARCWSQRSDEFPDRAPLAVWASSCRPRRWARPR